MKARLLNIDKGKYRHWLIPQDYRNLSFLKLRSKYDCHNEIQIFPPLFILRWRWVFLNSTFTEIHRTKFDILPLQNIQRSVPHSVRERQREISPNTKNYSDCYIIDYFHKQWREQLFQIGGFFPKVLLLNKFPGS